LTLSFELIHPMLAPLALACLLSRSLDPVYIAGAPSPACAPAVAARSVASVGYGFLTWESSSSPQSSFAAPAVSFPSQQYFSAHAADNSGINGVIHRRTGLAPVSTDAPGPCQMRHHLAEFNYTNDSVTSISSPHTPYVQETTANEPPPPSMWWLREFAIFLGLSGRHSSNADFLGAAMFHHLISQATFFLPVAIRHLLCSHLLLTAVAIESLRLWHDAGYHEPPPIAPHLLALAWPLQWAAITAVISPLRCAGVFLTYYMLRANYSTVRAAPHYTLYFVRSPFFAPAALGAAFFALARDFISALFTHIVLGAPYVVSYATGFTIYLTTHRLPQCVTHLQPLTPP